MCLESLRRAQSSVRQTRFFPHEDGLPGGKLRLIEVQEVLTGEVKYFLSNAPTKVPLKMLLAVGFSRWRIERLFEDSKQEVGLDHFEMRSYQGLMRHLILTMLSLYFLVEQTERLRGKNPWWTVCQVRTAIEAQLDPAMSPQERTRRLQKVAKKIAYWQQSAAKAAFSHDKRRRQDLRDLGIDLRRAIRCPLRI